MREGGRGGEVGFPGSPVALKESSFLGKANILMPPPPHPAPPTSPQILDPMVSLPLGSVPYSLGMTAQASTLATSYSSRRQLSLSPTRCRLWIASYLAES